MVFHRAFSVSPVTRYENPPGPRPVTFNTMLQLFEQSMSLICGENNSKSKLLESHAKTGEPKEHPAAKRMDALRRDYLKALTMLGLRASVAQPEEDKTETLEDILNG